jgi:hypothetical protein
VAAERRRHPCACCSAGHGWVGVIAECSGIGRDWAELHKLCTWWAVVAVVMVVLVGGGGAGVVWWTDH